MDRISELPDEILLNILSVLPTARDVVATMVLSKRWQLLWMMVPRLIYDDSYQNIEYERFSRFVDRSLILHEAPVIETLYFKLGEKSDVVGDIGTWIRIAVKRVVRKLIIEIDTCSSNKTPVTLSRSLYTCRTLVTLKLSNAVLVDDVSYPISFPSLKELSLKSMKYPGGNEYVKRLLSNCPVLEDLHVEQCPDDNVTTFTVKVPSLKFATLEKSHDRVEDDKDGFVVDAPSLEFLDIFNFNGAFCVIENAMPNMVEADFVFTHGHHGEILSFVTSVKSLYLCLPSTKLQDAYPVGTVFHRLVNLEICTCETEWFNLLLCLLRDSPNFRFLELVYDRDHTNWNKQPGPCWSEPSSIPECLLSSFETLKWTSYRGIEEDKEVAKFILRNANCLKKATFSTNSTDPDKKSEMLKELSVSPMCSPICQLLFD